MIQNLPHKFTSESVAKMMGNFVGEFVEFNAKGMTFGATDTMRVHVRVDVRNPLKRKKRIALPNGFVSYVFFHCEKLTLFYFLCGRLGHKESYCPQPILQEPQNLVLGWDISLRVSRRRQLISISPWLKEEGQLWMVLETKSLKA